MSTNYRRYRTQYAGLWNGNCLTPENAIMAGVKRVLAGAGKCTIIDRDTNTSIVQLRRREGNTGVEILTRNAIMAAMAKRMRKRAETMKRKLEAKKKGARA